MLSKLRFSLTLQKCVRTLHTGCAVSKQPPETRRRLMRKNPHPFHSVMKVTEYPEAKDALYPPIKPLYPPGHWGSMDPKQAWKYESLAKELDDIPDIFTRAKHLSLAEQNLWYHPLRLPLATPCTQDLAQYITASQILYESKPSTVSSNKPLSPWLLNQLAYQAKQQNLNDTQNSWLTKQSRITQRKARIIEYMENVLQEAHGSSSGHLKDAHIDEISHVESYIKRSGYEKLGQAREDQSRDDFNPFTHTPSLILNEVDRTVRDEFGHVKFTIRAPLLWKLRSNRALSEFVFPYDDICLNNNFPEFNYHPGLYDLKSEDHFSFEILPYHKLINGSHFVRNIGGYWCESPFHPSDPRPHGIFGVIDVGDTIEAMQELQLKEGGFDLSPELLKDQFLAQGILTAFAWCQSQAFIQGFHLYRDLDIPITCQLLLTDGHEHAHLLFYQLNTITKLWKPADAPLPSNVAWTMDLSKASSIRPILQCPTLASSLIGMLTAPVEEEVTKIEWRDFFQPDPLQEEEKKDRWNKANLPRIYVPPRPHPNRVFHFKETQKEDLMEEMQSTITKTRFGLLPHAYETKMREARLRKKVAKEGRTKTLKPPPVWQ